MRTLLPTTLAALALSACNQASAPTDDVVIQTLSRANAVGLTQQYAEFRAEQVTKVDYQLTVTPDPTLHSFSG